METSTIKLTRKQRLVLETLASDYNIPEAAAKLGISRRSLEGIVARLKDKFGVRFMQGLIAEAVRKSCINIQQLKKRVTPLFKKKKP